MIAVLKADELSAAPVGSAEYGALVTSMPFAHSPESCAEESPINTSIASKDATDAGPDCAKTVDLKTAIDTAGRELTSKSHSLLNKSDQGYVKRAQVS